MMAPLLHRAAIKN